MGWIGPLEPALLLIQGPLRVYAERLAALSVRLGDRIEADQRFAAMFLPQLCHGPWPPWEQSTDVERVWATRCHLMMQQQHVWLGDLLAQLETLGRLEHTVIVVSADHGVRTGEEHPLFDGDEIQGQSFHIPAMIHAPGVARGEEMNWPTSHIDLCPTLMALLVWFGAIRVSP